MKDIFEAILLYVGLPLLAALIVWVLVSATQVFKEYAKVSAIITALVVLLIIVTQGVKL